MLVQGHRELALPELHGSSLTASEPVLVYSAQKRTNGVWLLRQHVNVAQRSKQLERELGITSCLIYHQPIRAHALSNVD